MRELTTAVLRRVVPRPARRLGVAVIKRLRRQRSEWPLLRLTLLPLDPLDMRERRVLARRLLAAHAGIQCAHTHAEIVQIIRTISAVRAVSDSAVIVEAGCFKGGSTAKLSLAASAFSRRLVVFDSFEGIPGNAESHDRTIFGDEIDFSAGRYAGTLDEVRANVAQFGDVTVCEFVKGWFSDTMPRFSAPVVAAFIDVDLAESTRTCLQRLYPLLVPGGVLFSHDGHLPLCIEVLRDTSTWADVGSTAPVITGLGSRKLVTIIKPG